MVLCTTVLDTYSRQAPPAAWNNPGGAAAARAILAPGSAAGRASYEEAVNLARQRGIQQRPGPSGERRWEIAVGRRRHGWEAVNGGRSASSVVPRREKQNRRIAAADGE